MLQGLRRAGALLSVMSLGTVTAAAPVWAAAPTPAATLTFEDGRLSGRLDAVPFEQALAAVAQVLPGRITVTGRVGSEPVTIALHETTIASALRQLLRGRSYIVTEAADSADPGVRSAVEIVVLGERDDTPGRERRDLARTHADPLSHAEAPVRRSPPRPESELRHIARSGATAAERRGALTALAHRMPGRDSAALLAAALEDPDEQVRAAALRHLAARADAPPAAALARVAREDTSPHLRRRALEALALAQSAESERELHRALTDPDPGVRQRAESLLRDPLNAASPARESSAN